MRSVRLVVSGALGITLAAAACGHDSNQAPQTPPSPVPSATSSPTATPPQTPPPTPTPSGPVYLDSFFPNGTSTVPVGKCLGFTVVGNGVTFAPDATVKVGTLGAVETTAIDATHLRVGSKETGGTCVWTPIFGAAGAQKVTIASGADAWTLTTSLSLAPAQVYETGLVGTAQTYTSALVSSAGSNVFETPYDVDIYKVDTEWLRRVYTHLDFFDESGLGLIPQLDFYTQRYSNAPLGSGAIAEIFPENGPVYFAVRDVQGKGGSGAHYDLGATADVLADPPHGNTTSCHGIHELQPGTYHADVANLWNAFDPQGAPGCKDSLFGDEIWAGGLDSAWTVTVPAGKTLRAAAYDNHYVMAVYLMPADSCTPHPTTCTAAASHWGGGTNQIAWKNTTGSDQHFTLVFDTMGLNGKPDGAFLINLESLDHD